MLNWFKRKERTNKTSDMDVGSPTHIDSKKGPSNAGSPHPARRLRKLLLSGKAAWAVSLLLVATIIGTLGINVQDKSSAPGNQTAISIGEKVITIGDTALAAGAVDYTFDGVNDNVEFSLALNALPATGGRLVIVSATTINFDIAMAATGVTRAIDNVIIEGSGAGTYFVRNGAALLFTAGGNNWKFTNIRTDAGGIDMGATTGWSWRDITIGTTFYANSGTFSASGTPDYVVGVNTAADDVPGTGYWVKSGATGQVVETAATVDVSVQWLFDNKPNNITIGFVTGTYIVNAPIIYHATEDHQAAPSLISLGNIGLATDTYGSGFTSGSVIWQVSTSFPVGEFMLNYWCKTHVATNTIDGFTIKGINFLGKDTAGTLRGAGYYQDNGLQYHLEDLTLTLMATPAPSITAVAGGHQVGAFNLDGENSGDAYVENIMVQDAQQDAYCIFQSLVTYNRLTFYNYGRNGLNIAANGLMTFIGVEVGGTTSGGQSAIILPGDSGATFIGMYWQESITSSGPTVDIAASWNSPPYAHPIFSDCRFISSTGEGAAADWQSTIIRFYGNGASAEFNNCSFYVPNANDVKHIIYSSNSGSPGIVTVRGGIINGLSNLAGAAFQSDGTGKILVQDVQNYIAPGEVRTYSGSLVPTGTCTATTVSGTFTESPLALKPGANTMTCTASGTINVVMPAGSTAVVTSGDSTVTDSPKTCPAGATTLVTVTTGAGADTFTITVHHDAFAWHNPEAQDILIKKIVINRTAAGGTATAEINVGIADNGTVDDPGTEFFNNLLANNAAAIHDSYVAGGTSYGTQTIWVSCEDSASASGGWVVGKLDTEIANSLAGSYYIEYAGK